ncbi:MAG: Smr/MutS family protein [Candidatus Magnetominusculus sp. LBB02]|nr:Smr/MutS family protein [Candidatus Magnetominusculus sp. LBB02]
MSERLKYRPFEALKDISIKQVKTPASVVDDCDYFSMAMARVREIKEFREIPYSAPSLSVPTQRPSNNVEDAEALTEIVMGRSPVEICHTQEYVEWAAAGRGQTRNLAARKDLLLRLHKGEFAVQDYLDLHGFTLEEAELLINDFITESVRRRLRCVKIIHGRGLRSPAGPVLKEALMRWLTGRMRKHVSAFTTARGCDGGLGAVYVLLK